MRMLTSSSLSVIQPGWSDRLRLSYLMVSESQSPVLLVHGWGAFKELWWSTMLKLAPYYQVVAVDLPAHGDSPPAYRLTIRGLAEVLADFCTEQGWEQIALVGHSLGGNIALELALARPDLVQRLVLVDAAIDARRLPAFARVHGLPGYGWMLLRLRIMFNTWISLFGANIPHMHGGGVIRPWLRRSWHMRKHDPAGMQYILQGLFANPLSTRLPQVQATTLVMSGQFDRLVPLALSRQVAQAIPRARLVVIPHALHNPMDEQPVRFERELLAFLRETDV